MAKTVLQENKTQDPRCFKLLLEFPLLMPQQPKLHKGMGVSQHEALGAISELDIEIHIFRYMVYGPPLLSCPGPADVGGTSPLHQGLNANREPVIALTEIPALGVRPSMSSLHMFCKCYMCQGPGPIHWGYNPGQIDMVLSSRLHISVGRPGPWDELSTWS